MHGIWKRQWLPPAFENPLAISHILYEPEAASGLPIPVEVQISRVLLISGSGHL
jgi:hypothetical protein